MILFWSIAATMTAAALLFLLPPLLRARRGQAADTRQSANTAIYREQLDELAVELTRGAITQAEFDRASVEVERRIVAEHDNSVTPAKAGAQPSFAAAIAIGLLVPLFAAIGYWQLGSPAVLAGGAGGEGAHAASPEQMESLVERLSARLQQTPDDAEGWALLARAHFVLGNHERSAQAFAKALQRAPEDKSLLMELLKSLALAAHGKFESGDYAAAIGYWERILGFAPPDSEVAKTVNENIAEARALAGKASPPKEGASLKGTVSLDPAVAARASPGDTVFVIARALSGPRMPLAVARTTVAQLPYSFTLDDSMAMAPGATISSHSQVVVAARVSKSGNAIPQKGDIEGTSEPVAPGARGLRVVISRIVD